MDKRIRVTAPMAFVQGERRRQGAIINWPEKAKIPRWAELVDDASEPAKAKQVKAKPKEPNTLSELTPLLAADLN